MPLSCQLLSHPGSNCGSVNEVFASIFELMPVLYDAATEGDCGSIGHVQHGDALERLNKV
jgi:hypothetical protein